MKVSDIDLLIAADQPGIQAMLQQAGFTKAAVQCTRHYDIASVSIGIVNCSSLLTVNR
jgi:hypothetical protein